MKRLLFGASLVTVLTGIASAHPNAPSHAHPKPVPVKVAPADEYFGRLKMSILGIRNTIKDEGLKIDSDLAQGITVAKSCAFTEDAVHDWERKYPKDSWIPQTLWNLERVYQRVDSDEARLKAKATMVWLVHDFPSSPQAKLGRVELAQNKVGAQPAIVDASVTTATAVVPVTAVVPAPSPTP